MVSYLEEEEVGEEDFVEEKEDVEGAEVKVIRAGLDAMSVEYLDTLQESVLNKCELPLSLMVGVVKFKSLRLLSHVAMASKHCVKRHQNLLKVEIYCDERLLLERIDVEAPYLKLQLDCDLEEIDLNAPNLLLFKYNDITFRHNVAATSRKDSSLAKGYMKCHRAKDFDILSFLKLRQFLEKHSIFKVLELLIDVEELKLIQSPPYELEHVELKHLSFIRKLPVYLSLVDVVLWSFRPRSLTLVLYHFTNKGDVVEPSLSDVDAKQLRRMGYQNESVYASPGTIYQGIPEDLLLSLAEKQTAKYAWETLKTMFMGVDRVKIAKVQTLKAEFKSLNMKDTKIIDDFAMKVNNIVSNIQALGEKVEEAYVVKKLLRVVLSKFLQIASTIEQFADLDNMTVEEVIGRLKAHEERVRGKSESGEGKLLLTHQEWLEISKKKGDEEQKTLQCNTRSSASNNRGRGRGRGRGNYSNRGGRRSGGSYQNREGGRGSTKRNQEANLTQKDNKPALLLAVRHEVNEEVYLNEKHLTPKLRNLNEESNTSKVWYLDNRASNHMTGDREKFSDIDRLVQGGGRGVAAVVEARGDEWVRGSDRSGDGEYFWIRPEKFSDGDSSGGRRLAGNGERGREDGEYDDDDGGMMIMMMEVGGYRGTAAEEGVAAAGASVGWWRREWGR
ncbi:hypothetical protein Tco_0352743, partial [Tanacetum coccineum]